MCVCVQEKEIGMKNDKLCVKLKGCNFKRNLKQSWKNTHYSSPEFSVMFNCLNLTNSPKHKGILFDDMMIKLKNAECRTFSHFLG